MTAHTALVLHPQDDVAVALADLHRGDVVTTSDNQTIELRDDVPFGHKMAVRDIADGARVAKYGHGIGRATQAIRKGQWVHTHNLATTKSDAQAG